MPNKFQCEIVSLPEIYELCFQLSKQIIQSNYKVDVVIAIARGGFVPARLICDFLDINDLTSLKVTHYTATDKGEKASLQYPLKADISNKNVLLVDDVNDTGKSLKVALDHVAEFNPRNVKVAVMHEKNGSILQSDYFVESLKNWRWLIYEWAVIEDIGSFISKSNCTSIGDCLKMLEADYGLVLDSNYLKKILVFIDSEISME